MAPNSDGPGRSPQRENRTGSNQMRENLRSAQRWNDVPRGTMDEVSSYGRLNLQSHWSPKRLFHLVFESHDGRCYGAAARILHSIVADVNRWSAPCRS